MSFTVLYRWRLRPGTAETFREAWARGTRLIHRWCGSYGARLHFAGDEAWSYARWPSEEARQACLAHAEVSGDPCFEQMRACVEERFDEVVLDLVEDLLVEPAVVHPEVTLSTPRLVLRPQRLEDAFALHRAFSDPEQMRYWSGPPHTSIEESLDAMRRGCGNRDAQPFAITLREHLDDALGRVVLLDRRPGVAEIGYLLRGDAQGRGLAREAVAAVLDHAFGTRGLRRVYADTDPDNARSVRLLEGLGFTREAYLRADWVTHLGVRDTLIYGLLADDHRR